MTDRDPSISAIFQPDPAGPTHYDTHETFTGPFAALIPFAGVQAGFAAHASALARLWRAVDEAPQLAADATLFHVARQQRTAAALLPFTAADQRGLQLTAYLAAPSTPASLTDELAQLAAQTPERLVQLAQDRLGEALEGFEVLPRRWVVERTFAWLGRCRRLAKDWERSIESSTAWANIASIRMLTRRIARLSAA